MSPRVLGPLVAALLAVAVTGCGEEPSPSPTASDTPVQSPAASIPTMTPPTAPPSLPTDVRTPLTLTGTVVRADETCVDVEADTGIVWSLVGDGVEALVLGDRVTVVGRVPVDHGDQLHESGSSTACGGETVNVEKLRTP